LLGWVYFLLGASDGEGGKEGKGTGTPGPNFVGKEVVLRIHYEYEYQSLSDNW